MRASAAEGESFFLHNTPRSFEMEFGKLISLEENPGMPSYHLIFSRKIGAVIFIDAWQNKKTQDLTNER